MYSHPTLIETIKKRVEKVIFHPKYKGIIQTPHLDIAILKIPPVSISDTIYPCCLPPTSRTEYIGKKAIG